MPAERRYWPTRQQIVVIGGRDTDETVVERWMSARRTLDANVAELIEAFDAWVYEERDMSEPVVTNAWQRLDDAVDALRLSAVELRRYDMGDDLP